VKIQKLVNIGTLPKGDISVAALSNETCEKIKWKKIIQGIPHGVAKCNSMYSQYNIVVLSEDAIQYSIPYIQIQNVKNPEIKP
jgi:hypothetical protein